MSASENREDHLSQRPTLYDDVESCVDATITRIGRRIRLGTPLGLGKANHLVNEFFRRAREDPRIELRIFTALTLSRPVGKSDLERRFIDPLAERLFGGYPELAYMEPLRRSELPSNIQVNEFYFHPGSFLESPLAQQQYTSSNYSHVVRDTLAAGINVLAQLVAKSDANAPDSLSLGARQGAPQSETHGRSKTTGNAEARTLASPGVGTESGLRLPRTHGARPGRGH